MRISGRVLVAVFSALLAATGLTAQAPQINPPAAITVPPPPPAESLPRPDFRFKGQVGRTYQDSAPPPFQEFCGRPRARPTSC